MKRIAVDPEETAAHKATFADQEVDDPGGADRQMMLIDVADDDAAAKERNPRQWP